METKLTLTLDELELDSRVESYENGTAKAFTFEEIKKAVVEGYRTKKKSTRRKYRIPR